MSSLATLVDKMVVFEIMTFHFKPRELENAKTEYVAYNLQPHDNVLC